MKKYNFTSDLPKIFIDNFSHQSSYSNWNGPYFYFSSYSSSGDEIKSTSTETAPAVIMILSLHKEIGGASKLIIFPDQLLKMMLFYSHVIGNDSTHSDCTNCYKIRDKLQNTLIPPEMNFRRISAVTKDTNRFSLQEALKWKNTFPFQRHYFVVSCMSFIVIQISALHPQINFNLFCVMHLMF